jgi:hypothetical protein
MADGELTAKAARELTARIGDPGFDVLFDHGDSKIDPPDRIGNISSWFGGEYSAKSQLALLDIAVVDREHNRAIVLVEIEETSSSPKVAIGDAFGTILGDQITFQGTRHLAVGHYTSLLVLLNGGNVGHRVRIKYLQDQITDLINDSASGNSAIGRITMDLFQGEDELLAKLSEFVIGSLASYAELR